MPLQKGRGDSKTFPALQRCRVYGFYVVFPFVCCLPVKCSSTRYMIAWYGLESCCYMLGWLADSRQPLVFMVCARNQRWKAGIPQIRVGSMHGSRISKTTMLLSSLYRWIIFFQGVKRDVVYLGWPIAPSYMRPNAGGMGWGVGGLRGLNQWVVLCSWSPNKL